MAQAAAHSLRNALGVVSAPFIRFGKAYAAAAEKRPFAVGVITTGVKTSAADLFAQMVMERRQWHEIDTKRHFTFCLFGFTYLGAFQYFFYTKVLVWVTNPITRTMGHIASAPAKTFVDQAIHHPFMYFPTFYLMKYTLVGGDSVDLAMTRYSDELWPNCNALWKLWVPCQVPYVAAVSFVWTIILSMMRGSDTGAVEDKQATQATIEHPSATTPELAAPQQPVAGKQADSAKEADRLHIGADPTPPLAAGSGVPVGGILAVASQSLEQPEAAPLQPPTSALSPAPSSVASEPALELHQVPARAPAIDGLTGTAPIPALGFTGHAHASIAAPHPRSQLDHQSAAIAAAASMSEHQGVHVRTQGSATSAHVAASIAEPLVGFSQRSLVSGVLGAWGGAAGLLHLQHPLAADS